MKFPAELKLHDCIMFDRDRSGKVVFIVPKDGISLDDLKQYTEQDLLISITPGKFKFHATIAGFRYAGDHAYAIKFRVPASEVADTVKFLAYSEKVLTVTIEEQPS